MTKPAPKVVNTPSPQTLWAYLEAGPNGQCKVLGPAGNPPAGEAGPYPLAVVAAIPTCPPTPVLDPATVAVRFWQTIPLPKPAPQIPPGYAITGQPAYLVTNGLLHPTAYVRATPLGTLTITASGDYQIDWGDGSSPTWTGPYDLEGEPWPDGSITHNYDVAGTYTVTVTENWTATWTLAGATGVLGGLHTQATIPGYRVEQLQAVITG